MKFGEALLELEKGKKVTWCDEWDEEITWIERAGSDKNPELRHIGKHFNVLYMPDLSILSSDGWRVIE